jgi:DNA-binding beta-propeller fold protein YncE
MKRNLLIFSLPVLTLLYAGCIDEASDAAAQYDPNVPVAVERFTPDSGGAATQLMIYGSNFGTDTSQIRLTVNGKPATVIGSSSSVLYALVPPQVRPDTGFCEVKLRVGEQEVACEKQFHYAPKYIVSTIIGDFVDEARNGAVIDGSFEEARFNEPYWLAFDEKKNLYLIEENNGLRYIDFESRTVSTKFRTGNGMNRPRTIAFTPDYDTMIIAHDASAWTDMGQAMLTRADNFTAWTSVCKSRQCNGGAFHPVHHDYYFNSYEASQVYKVRNRHGANSTSWDFGGESGYLFYYGDKNWEFNIQFAPSGNFAYLVSINRHYVGKVTYDWNTREIKKLVDVFVGGKDQSGYADGGGTSARFENPHQGAFDENDNFYLCDALNQCIRKITPEGIVTTFAGRPDEWGIVDGDLRTAQFDRPWGIVYDVDTKTFYVADQKNRRIRTITYQ